MACSFCTGYHTITIYKYLYIYIYDTSNKADFFDYKTLDVKQQKKISLHDIKRLLSVMSMIVLCSRAVSRSDMFPLWQWCEEIVVE